jgi:rod shape-determining protein MreD
VLLEVSFFSRITLIGSRPAFAALIVILLGLMGGVMVGAVSGFAIGFLIDSLVGLPLGLTALSLILVGYLAGVYRERSTRPSGRFALPLICVGLTLIALISQLVLQLLLGISGDFSGKFVPDLIVCALYALLLSLPINALLRRILRPALIDEADFHNGGSRPVFGNR